MWNLIFFLQKDTNELIYKTEADLQISKTNYGYQRGNMVGRDKPTAWDEYTHYHI